MIRRASGSGADGVEPGQPGSLVTTWRGAGDQTAMANRDDVVSQVLDLASARQLTEMLRTHAERTGSRTALGQLADLTRLSREFVVLLPKGSASVVRLTDKGVKGPLIPAPIPLQVRSLRPGSLM